MGEVLILALIAGYIWVVAAFFKRVGPYWAKALVVVAALLLPTADTVYGRMKLKQMCEAESGLHVYRVIENAEGFDYPIMTPNDEWITKYGYHFIEGEELSGKRSRVSLQPNGKIVREKEVTPIAKYVFELDKGDVRDTFQRIESRLVARDSGEVLARVVNMSYAGGWFERLVNGLYAARGTARRCGPDILITELVTKTLKPKK